uniref:Small integral membrane protein 45 n=1 Tax=Sus scrofa TaxID=9823 RepID=A0A8D1NT39_PIG
MPHFLDWFVPVYLFISVLILVGFGACIYYFEPGLQEAHKWRMQRPLVDRDFRKTLMVRDNLAFGGPEGTSIRLSQAPAPGPPAHLEPSSSVERHCLLLDKDRQPASSPPWGGFHLNLLQ